MLQMRDSEEPPTPDDHSATPSVAKPGSLAPTPSANTPEVTASRSSDSSQEATEADRREARQLLSREGAMRKTGWLLLRSNGPNLSSVVQCAGAKNFQVRQLYSLPLDRRWYPHCFILLYKWSPDRGDRVKWNPQQLPSTFAGQQQEDSPVSEEGIMFCGHMMDNASATQALMMALINIPESGAGATLQYRDGSQGVVQHFDIGDKLRILKGFLKPLDPVLRGAALCSADVVRTAHNEAAKRQYGGHPELLDEDGKVRSTLLAEELWMYSVYIPGKDDHIIYELRSMAEEAEVATYPEEGETWITAVERPIMKNIETFRQHNTPFLLFTVKSDIKPMSLPRVPRKVRIPDGDDAPEDSRYGNSSDLDASAAMEDKEREEGDSEGDFDDAAAGEELTRIRATHNYDTFFIEMMKLMASRGDINSIIKGEDMLAETSSEEE